jgi:hypothetical protein
MTPPQRWKIKRLFTEANMPRQNLNNMGGGAAAVGEVPTPSAGRLDPEIPLYENHDT